MADCNRPRDRKEEKKEAKKVWKMAKLPADQLVSLVVYAGCVEGDKATFSIRGDDRRILLEGTAVDIAKYTVGEATTIGKVKYAARNVAASQKEAVNRINDEMQGTGAAAQKAREQGGRINGYAITVNGQRVTPDSVINHYFREMVFVQTTRQVKVDPQNPNSATRDELVRTAMAYDEVKGKKEYEGKIISAPGKTEPMVFLGGVEMIVSAIIVPGSENASGISRTTGNDLTTYLR